MQWSRVAYVPCLCFLVTSCYCTYFQKDVIVQLLFHFESLMDLIVAVLNTHRCGIVEVLETRPTKQSFFVRTKKKFISELRVEKQEASPRGVR